MGIHAQRRDQQTTAPAQSRYDTGLAWSGVLKPATPNGCRATQKNEEQCVNPAEHGDRPVTCGGENLLEETHVRGRKPRGDGPGVVGRHEHSPTKTRTKNREKWKTSGKAARAWRTGRQMGRKKLRRTHACPPKGEGGL